MTQSKPILFIGHGNPMNAIEQNEFSDTWQALGSSLPRPESILCISAHWETDGIALTAMPNPKTIHDFGGFPKALYEVQYPAPGNPNLALEIIYTITKYKITADYSWGLDHGCWSILHRMFPKADIPVVQLSINVNKPASYHFTLAKELAFLRQRGVMIIGSGNIVHNLRKIEWGNPNGSAWAETANQKLKEFILADDNNSLFDYQNQGLEIQQAIPTPEHYLPLLYILALKNPNETISFFNDKLVMGSLSMTSLIIS